MTRIYESVDIAAIDGSIAACAATALAQADYNREVQESGALGSGTHIITTNTINQEHAIHLESEANEPNSTSWPSGTWVVRFNVTTGNSNVELRATYICRLNSSGVDQGLVGQEFSLTVPLTAGVQARSISGAGPAASATDRFYFVGDIRRISGAHGNQSCTITNDQLIDTPFAALSTPPGEFLKHPINPLLRM